MPELWRVRLCLLALRPPGAQGAAAPRPLPAPTPHPRCLACLQVRAIQSDSEDVAMQAIEFWCTLDEYEYDILESEDDTEVCAQARVRARERGPGAACLCVPPQPVP